MFRRIDHDSPPIIVPVLFCKRGGQAIIKPVGDAAGMSAVDPDRALIRGMIRAYRWRAKLESGEARSIEALARAENPNATCIAKNAENT